MIEALARGTPVAAYPVPGPVDVLARRCWLHDADLDRAIAQALKCDRATCAAYSRSFSWAASAQQFLAALAPLEIRLAPVRRTG